MKIKENIIKKYNLLDGIIDFEKKNILTQLDCCYSDTIVSWPQIETYHDLYSQYKDALYILNKREPEKILHYFKAQNKMDERFLNFFIKNNSNIINTDEYIINYIKQHYDTIENYFKDKSNFISFDVESFSSKYFQKFIYFKDDLKLPICNSNISINKNIITEVLHHNSSEKNICINKSTYDRFPYSSYDINICYDINKYNYISRNELYWFKNNEEFTLYCLNKNVILFTYQEVIVGFILVKNNNITKKIVLFGYNENIEDTYLKGLIKTIILDEIIFLLTNNNYVFEASNRTSWFLRKKQVNIITDKLQIENILQLKKNDEIVINNNFNINDPMSYHYTHYYNKKYMSNVILFGNI